MKTVSDKAYCPHSFFDFIVDVINSKNFKHYKFFQKSEDLVAIRSGRCGFTLMIGGLNQKKTHFLLFLIGFYLILLGAEIFIPKKLSKKLVNFFNSVFK